MAQVRVKRESGFTVLPNEALQDATLTLKAKGLLAYMLSVPEDWDYSIEGLSQKCCEGKAAIRGAIEELIGAGYVVREQSRSATGAFSGYEYIVYDTPQPLSPSCENCTTDDAPSCDFPSSENRTQENNNNTKKEFNKTPYSPPAGDVPKVDTGLSRSKYMPEWFDRFYAFYPVHKGRKNAARAWDKLRPSRDLCGVMAKAIDAAKLSDEWQRDGGKYIPMPATWLNGRRWEDTVSPARAHDPGGGWADDPEVI